MLIDETNQLDKNDTHKIYSGTSGLVIPIPKRSFPPEFADKSRLTFYASLFNSIEINSSFYKIPMAATMEKWAASVPDDFRFTFKLWKGITHNKELLFNTEDVERFMTVIDPVGNKKGCLLVQFPPSLSVNTTAQVEKLLANINHSDSSHKWNLAVEFRHQSWNREQTYELLDQYGAGIVLHDKSRPGTMLRNTEAQFVYLRFHGPGGDYRGSYDDQFLNEYAGYIREWMDEGKEVYVYFNNTMGDALQNLQTLNSFCSEAF